MLKWTCQAVSPGFRRLQLSLFPNFRKCNRATAVSVNAFRCMHFCNMSIPVS